MRDELGISISMSDGVEVSVRIYRPDGSGPFPTLFAASPYRYDNDDIPESMVFFWHEVGPIHWYVERGYAYVHLDVRGSGRSQGEYGLFNRRERRDLYEVIEWIAVQPWSNGKVGGIGQSYYAAAQWCMAAERPPHLSCVAPYDGHIDYYRGWFYSGGIQSNFANVWWNGSVRLANQAPRNGVQPRLIEYDLVNELAHHPLIDDFWDDRSIDAQLAAVEIPVYSVGIWIKRDLHLDGNVRGYHLVKGPKKLAFSGVQNLPLALAEFASVAFHERVLAPFYDHYLKGDATDYPERPAVDYHVIGEDANRAAEIWPPAGIRWDRLHLSAQPAGAVTSLNDGSLRATTATGPATTSFFYPDPQWAVGPVAMGPHGPEPIRRVTTWTTAPLDADLLITGAPRLALHLSSTRDDANVIAKLSMQRPPGAAQAPAQILAKGWLRASQRALEPAASMAGEPYHSHRTRQPLVAGEVYELHIPLSNIACRVPKGARLRLELTCADSTLTDLQFTHIYTPDMVGCDSYHHDAEHPSALYLPILEGSLSGNINAN